MSRDLITFLTDLRKRKNLRAYSEADTKQSVVLRVLQYLGWNIFDPDEVRPEYEVGSTRVDYALCPHTAPKVFLEVKRLDEPLDRHEEQLISYSTRQSVRLAVLTNGVTWWLYLPLVEGKWDEKKFYTLDVVEQEPERVAERFAELMSRESTVSGKAILRAEAILQDKHKSAVIRESIPAAWDKLITDADERLVALLKETTEKLCGYELEEEAIVEFFENRQPHLIFAGDRGPLPRPQRKKPSQVENSLHGAPPSKSRKRAKGTTIRVRLDWSTLGGAGSQEVIEDGTAVSTFVRTLRKIAEHIGTDKFSQLKEMRVNRGMLLSSTRTKYHLKEVAGYYVLSYNSTDEKAAILRAVLQKLGLPKKFIDVKIVE